MSAHSLTSGLDKGEPVSSAVIPIEPAIRAMADRLM